MICEQFNAAVSTMAAGLPDSAIAAYDRAGVNRLALCGDAETTKRLYAWFDATREAIGATSAGSGDRATVRAMQKAIYRRYGVDAVSASWCSLIWAHFIAHTRDADGYRQAMVGGH